MKVSIIICTYNRPDSLAVCLHSIEAQFLKPDEVVVVEDDSTSKIVKVVEEFNQCDKFKLTHVLTGKRTGLPATRNTGVRAAKGDILAFIDDDVILPPNWLAEVVKCYQETNADGVGGYIHDVLSFKDEKSADDFLSSFFYRLISAIRLVFFYNKVGKLSPIGLPYAHLNLQTNGYREVDYFQGCNMTFRCQVFDCCQFDESCGGFREHEPDFCLRLKKANKKLIYNPRAVVIHTRNQAGGTRSRERLYWTFQIHTFYLLKDYNLKYLRVAIFAALSLLYSIFSRRLDCLRGVRDGVKQYRQLGKKPKLKG